MRDRTDQSAADGRYVVFDLETLYLSHEVRGGWRNIRDFGLAVGVTIDEHGRQHVWQEPDAQDLIDYLAEHPRVVGFNSRRFDLTVLSAYGDVSGAARAVVRRVAGTAIGHGPAQGHAVAGHRRRDVRRGQVAERRHRGGPLWRTGRPDDRRRVIDYCAQDVQLTKRILEFGVDNGYVLVPVPNLRRGRSQVPAEVPVAWGRDDAFTRGPR